MKPKFLLVNWSRGEVVGTADTEKEVRSQLEKASLNSERFRDSFLIAEVKVLSEMRRVEQ